MRYVSDSEFRAFKYDVCLTPFNVLNPRHVKGIVDELSPFLYSPKMGKFTIKYYSGNADFPKLLTEILFRYDYLVSIIKIQPSNKYVSHYELEIFDVLDNDIFQYCENCKTASKRFSLGYDKLYCLQCEKSH